MERDAVGASILLVGGGRAEPSSHEAALAPPGVRLVTVDSVDAALPRLAAEPFALVLLRLPPPGEEGVDAVRQLHAGAPAVPLALLGDTPGPERLREVRALGAVDWLDSAWPPEVLQGRVALFVALFQRTAELHHTREALGERDERLRLVLETSGVGHWRLDLATMRLEVSEGCKRNFGLPVDGDLSSYEALRALIHPEDRAGMAEAVEQTLATGRDYASDYRVVPPSGAPRWVAARGRVVADASGRPVGMVGITLDTTQRMRGERALGFLSEASRLLTEPRETEDTLQRMARLATAGVATYCVVDLLQEDGTFRRVATAHREAAQEELLHATRRFAPRLDDTSLVAQTLRENWTRLLSPLTAEHRRRSLVDDEHRSLVERLGARSVLLVPMRTRERPWGVISFVRTDSETFDEGDLDMAEELGRRVSLALDNAQLLRTTREAVRTRDEFLSVASHELKTPLTPLSLRLQALARSVQLGRREALEARLPGDVDAMRQQVKRLSELTNELLDVSRIGTDQLVLELEPVELVTLAREVLSRFEPEARRAGCALQLAGEEALHGQWDRARLGQVLSNLLSNAIKYGAGRPIHLQVERGGAQARLVVRDEGIGIEPQALPRLFGKFERAVSERHYGGLGLGLYISRRIVEALGGRIRVESTPGRGATFITELPLAPPPR